MHVIISTLLRQAYPIRECKTSKPRVPEILVGHAHTHVDQGEMVCGLTLHTAFSLALTTVSKRGNFVLRCAPCHARDQRRLGRDYSDADSKVRNKHVTVIDELVYNAMDQTGSSLLMRLSQLF